MLVSIDRPIFVIGTGRCGSTILFEALARHPDLGWFSNYDERFPSLVLSSIVPRIYSLPGGRRLPRGEKPQFRQGLSRLNRVLPKPAEAYPKWERLCGRKFLVEYLIGIEATEAESRAVRRHVAWLLFLQKKRRFAAKLTGPGRIGYLHSIFPDARFIHVMRDGRSVVDSWLQVDYWKVAGAHNKPFWDKGLPASWRQEWYAHGATPAALAALQYRTIIQSTRQESRKLQSDQYIEITYERFVQEPSSTMARVLDFCQLPPSARIFEYVGEVGRYQNMNQFRETFSNAELQAVDEIVADVRA